LPFLAALLEADDSDDSGHYAGVMFRPKVIRSDTLLDQQGEKAWADVKFAKYP
jgi:hypothetical protein